MAITRAQQYRQMLENGGRGISLQEAKDMAPKGEFLAYINKKEAKMLKDAGGSGIMTNAGIPSFIEYDDSSGSGFKSAKSTGTVRGDVDRGNNYTDRIIDVAERKRRQDLRDLTTKLAEDKAEEQVERFRNKKIKGIPFGAAAILNPLFQKGATATRNFFLNKVLPASRLNYKGKKLTPEQFANLSLSEQEDLYKGYLSDRSSNKTDAYGNPIMGGDDNLFIPVDTTFAQPPGDTDQGTETEDQDEGLRLAFRANGGRIGLAKGSRMQSGEVKESRTKSSAPTNPNKRVGAVDEKTTDPRITPGGDKPTRPIINDKGIGSLTSKKDIPTFNNDITRINLKDLMGLGLDDQEEENIQLAEAINFGTLPQAQEKFEPDFGGMLDATQNLGKSYKGTTRGDFIDAIEAGAFGPGTQQMFDRNVGDVFQGVPLDASFFSTEVGDVNPQFINPKGSFGGTIDIRKDQLANPEDLPAGFFKGAEGGRAGFAGGGMPYEGGIMDLESGRQMYFLGKLVKKATRAVKKIAKSPVGKAALLYAGTAGLGAFGAGAARAGTGFGIFSPTNVLSNLGASKALLTNKLFGDAVAPNMTRTGGILEKALGFVKDKPFQAITAASVVAGLLTPQQEDQAQLLADNTGIDIEEARNQILRAASGQDDFRARAFKADGGIMRLGYQEGSKEPVAKETMPLLDMDGKEMDLREDGGFVPIGRMEKADDVPARLSKNEFVFTADAVRNAGDGDVDKGAEVMYNMMKNLESGGDVSEESQGLEGARRMFQTSQRLEEVL